MKFTCKFEGSHPTKGALSGTVEMELSAAEAAEIWSETKELIGMINSGQIGLTTEKLINIYTWADERILAHKKNMEIVSGLLGGVVPTPPTK